MHGNERLGVELVKLLKNRPLSNITTLVANPGAVSSDQRFIETDLNRSFGDQVVKTYESKRAQYIQSYAAQFDLVLDFHNTQTPNNNCVFVGLNRDPQLFKAVKILGLNNCVEATYDCINKYCPNVVSVEISIGDKLDDATYWYEVLEDFSYQTARRVKSISIYRFNQRITWRQKRQFKITGWQPFKPIDTVAKTKLKLNGIIVPIFIGSKLTEYYATVLTKERTE